MTLYRMIEIYMNRAKKSEYVSISQVINDLRLIRSIGTPRSEFKKTGGMKGQINQQSICAVKPSRE